MDRRRIWRCVLLLALRTCLPVAGELALPLTAQELTETVIAQTLGRRLVPAEADAVLPEPTPESAVTPAPTVKPTAAPAPSPTPAPLPTPEAEPAPAGPAPSPETAPEGVRILSYTDGEDGTRLRNYTDLQEDWASLSEEPLTQALPASGVQVLLVHTHGTEAYTPEGDRAYAPSDTYHTTDNDCNVVHLGDLLQAALTRQGLTVAHIRAHCDYPSYTGSYDRCEELVTSALEEDPEIAVIIDLHRDAIGDDKEIYRTVTAIDGEECAQVMLVVGTGENGLAHPQWRENLKLAMALTDAGNDKFPGLFRPIHLVPERYNQQLSTGSLLLEVGTTGNTLSESERAVEYLSEVLGPFLRELQESV